MKISRLYQPRNPRFWLVIALNLSSTVLAWIARNHELAPVAGVVVVILALGNAALGLGLMWSLVKDGHNGR